MKVGDKIGNHDKIYSTNGEYYPSNHITGRIVKLVDGDKFQLVGDYSLWFYIKDIEQELNYEIY